MAYKILSLDGGGSWAMIQARVLLDIYGDIRGHELLRKFNMTIANSGGSLVLACLCNDMKLSEIISVFTDQKQRKLVFSGLTLAEKLKRRNIISMITRHLGPKYDTKRKHEGLLKVLKEHDHLYASAKIAKPVAECFLDELPAIIGCDLKIIIVGFDYFRERATFFRSDLGSNTDKFSSKFQITLVDAIHSSSNAPVNYFDAPAEVEIHYSKADMRQKLYWDGAVSGFNNPVLAGLVEATTNNYEKPEDYCILSIGTGTGSRAILTDYKHSTDPAIKAIYDKNRDNPLAITDTSFSFADDIKKMSTSILGDPPDSATFIAYSILDPSLSNTASLVRINPCIAPEKDENHVYGLPSAYKNEPTGKNKFIRLLDMDMDAVEDDEIDLIIDLCDKFINEEGLRNQLIRGNPGDEKILGQASYRKAKEKWITCSL